MRPPNAIKRLAQNDSEVYQYLESIASLCNQAAMHVSAARLQLAESALAEARDRLRACLPVSREDFERIGMEE